MAEKLLSLTEYAAKILATGDATEKAQLSEKACELWQSGRVIEVGQCVPPDKPSRPDYVKILPPRDMPKRGKGGTLENRIAMLHSLVHIESVAIDLSWDIIARFGPGNNMPKDFYDDWVKVAQDESRHHSLLHKRLKELGANYGDLPAHEGLWECALATANDFLARLAIEHMVHEARGLDVTPTTIARFRSAKDKVTADLLEEILKDEITHVTAGIKWFTFICSRFNPPKDPISTFIEIVPKYFRGPLKPPFNTKARQQAGMAEEWYLPLIKQTNKTTN